MFTGGNKKRKTSSGGHAGGSRRAGASESHAPKKARPHRKKTKSLWAQIVGVIFTGLITALVSLDKLLKRAKKIKFPDAKKYIYHIAVTCAISTVAVVIALIVWLSTNINGLEIYLDGDLIGTIKEKTKTVEEISTEAIAKLSTEQGVPVKVNEEITVNPVHAREFVNYEYVIGEIFKRFTYSVQAAIIVIDDVEIATVRTRKDANSILEEIKNEFYQDGLNIISIDFVERDEIKEVFVEKSKIISNEEALALLTANKKEENIYTVIKGDTLGRIASNAGMTLEEIYNLNPGLDPDPTKLKLGAQIKISQSVPFLSVVTKARDEITQIIEMPVETVYDDTKPRSHSKIIQQGKAGKETVVVDIIRINGVESGQDIIDRTVEEEPVAQITEVGTK